MNIPVRLVCSACGRSVDEAGCRSGEAPARCPGCGATLASEFTSAARSDLPTPDVEPWSSGSGRVMPDAIGRFRPRTVLGGGGFGHVYLAYDPRLERDVALKVLKDPRPVAGVEQRFFREARAAAQLDHPNIVPLHDTGRDSGVCWIAYQHVAGTTLSRYREDHAVDAATAARIVLALADALDHAHRRGVYHRDLKPSNVLIDTSGQPRLTDFGLARRVDVDPTITVDGAILGTPAYMSPEQADGHSHQADGQSDVYSLGAIFHELLTGHKPAMPDSQVSGQATPGKPRKIPTYGRDRSIPRALDRICLRALAIDPADRYPDARALAAALDSWLRRRDALARFRKNAGLAAVLLASVGVAIVDAIAPRGGATAPRPKPVPKPPAFVPSMVLKNVAKTTPATASAAFFVEKGKRLFHASSCPLARKVPPGDRHSFSAAGEATALGYVPCALCRPR